MLLGQIHEEVWRVAKSQLAVQGAQIIVQNWQTLAQSLENIGNPGSFFDQLHQAGETSRRRHVQ
jgi:myosin-crossreactive antigen